MVLLSQFLAIFGFNSYSSYHINCWCQERSNRQYYVYRLHQKRLCYWLLFIGAEISLINITSQSKHAIPCYSVSQKGTDVTLYFALRNIIIYIFFNSTVLVNWAIENTAYRLCVGWIPSKLNHLSEREPTKTI